MDKYIIIKATRWCSGPVATEQDAYKGLTAEHAGIQDGLVYRPIELALRDAERLTKENPTGFEVWRLGDACPFYYTKDQIQRGLDDMYELHELRYFFKNSDVFDEDELRKRFENTLIEVAALKRRLKELGNVVS